MICVTVRIVCGCVALVLASATYAMGQDCTSHFAFYLASGTTAQVTIFNGQGVVSYAKFTDMTFSPAKDKNPPYLGGLADQLFNDRTTGMQPFDVNRKDK